MEDQGTKKKRARSRAQLSYQQKYLVVKWIEQREAEGLSLTRSDISKYVEEQFEITVSPAFVTQLRKSSSQIKDYVLVSSEEGRSRKKARKSSVEELNSALSTWLEKKESQRATITEEVIVTKAREFAVGLSLPPRFNFGRSWISNFKKMRGMRSAQLHGEAGSANIEGINKAQQKLPILLSGTDLRDIYNMDETALWYRRLPTSSIMKRKRKGCKLSKERITLSIFASSDGHDVFAQVIGTSKRPRSFGRSFDPDRDLGIQYFSNKSAWMTSVLFNKVMQRFNGRMRHEGRVVWLLLDNCSAHGIPIGAKPCCWMDAFEGFTMSAVKAIFLPPNTTAVLQPLDQGVIQAFKAHYRRQHVRWMIQELDKDHEKSAENLKVDLRSALFWVRDALKEVRGSTTRNCFRKSAVLPPANTAEIRALDERDRAKSSIALKAAVDEMVAAFESLGLGGRESITEMLEEKLTSIDAEDESASGEEIPATVETSGLATRTESSDEGEPEPEPVMTLAEAKTASTKLHSFVLENVLRLAPGAEEQMYGLMKSIQGMVECEGHRQAAIGEFFGAVDDSHK
eukprot:scaffold908_cov228-Pinguiococcus_pyrenoidosus.AAC.15